MAVDPFTSTSLSREIELGYASRGTCTKGVCEAGCLIPSKTDLDDAFRLMMVDLERAKAFECVVCGWSNSSHYLAVETVLWFLGAKWCVMASAQIVLA